MDKYLGKRLDGRYEMRELIGVGGMAYVYKAYDCLDDRTVAVKILKDEFLTNEEFTRRFRNESKAIAILNHPNIVKVLDVGFGERLQYIVMEYIDGITLKEYLDQRRDIRWKEAVHFAVQILRALQHAHDKGIVHRDIKPQNIMLLSDGTIKVTDFGIARLSRNELRATVEGEKAIGSVHYISPEQARGDITDEKADLYSVGVALYEMLTGRLPFEADNAVSVAIMQMQTEPTQPHLINAEIPEGLEQITMKAMQKDTSKRYQSAAEMLSDFEEFKKNPSIRFEYTYFVDETPTRYVDAITRVRGEGDGAVTDVSVTREKKKISSVAILSAVAAAVVIVCVAFVLIFTGMFSGDSVEEIPMDNFVGKDYNDVLNHPNISFYDIDVRQEPKADIPENQVYKQDPLPNTIVKKGCRVTLYVAQAAYVKVPDFQPGENKEDVEKRLKGKGFKVQTSDEVSTTYAKDTVIRLDPKPGESLVYGSTVIMHVSSGEEPPKPIDMPNVLGLSFDNAKKKLLEAGFSNVEPEYVNADAAKDTVVAATPDHSMDQLPSVEIVLQVSTGYRNVEIEMALPKTQLTASLEFYVNGTEDEALSASHASIIPITKNPLKFTVGAAKDTYSVIVKLSIGDKINSELYAEYTVNGKTGEYQLVSQMTGDEFEAKLNGTTPSEPDGSGTENPNPDDPSQGESGGGT
ncbi:MAG: Stk1 family PASTA domain-containing Ser/Thr kinase [Ruminococcaceae bacterium]|nr:Stk1 family PASTA domain-containing Ser/Thr kinase [Oscillospiraceae bacterium]